MLFDSTSHLDCPSVGPKHCHKCWFYVALPFCRYSDSSFRSYATVRSVVWRPVHRTFPIPPGGGGGGKLIKGFGDGEGNHRGNRPLKRHHGQRYPMPHWVANPGGLTLGFILLLFLSLCLSLFALLDCAPNFSSVWIIAYFLLPISFSLSQLSS